MRLLGIPENVEQRPFTALLLREVDRLDPVLRQNLERALGKTQATEEIAKRHGLKVKRFGRRHA